jgi:hypothetical protein
MSQALRLFAAPVLCLCLLAADPAKAPLALRSPVQDKNFYLLSMIERTSAVHAATGSDPALTKLAGNLRTRLRDADSCGSQVDCYTSAPTWQPDEIAAAASALRSLYAADPGVARMVDGPLRASGVFQLHQDLPGPEFLAQSFTDAAKAINHIVEVYGAGHAPRYPAIDSISFDVKASSYAALLHTIVGVLNEDSARMDLFFQPPMRFALALLEANHRDEPARFEPLEAGENAAAIGHVHSIAWDRFPYSVIVVPGAGPDRPSWSLSAMGKLRLELAVRRFHEGKAPLILVSGGCVHPADTPYAEAIEMKKSLIADFGIAPSSILVDPYARHTTTNLRNAAREIYRYGIPFDKPALITTDQDQSAAIESPRFATRCMQELGYVPGKFGPRLSGFDLEFLPAVVSLHADAIDPLDP